MPKITELTYSRGETRQLKPYEPTNVHMSIKAEVEEGEDLHQAYLKLQKIVDDEVALQITILDESKTGRVVRAGAKAVLEKDAADLESVPF